MRSLPTLSVCVPVYNGQDFIERSIDSILTQSLGDFELLVVDNASTDDTVAVVETFDDPRLRLVRNDSNIGLVGNHNKCLSLATGELLQFVHSDDWLLPRCFEKLVPTFVNHNVGLSFAPRRVVTEDVAWKERYGHLHAPLEPLSPVNNGPAIVRKYVQAGAEGNWIGEPTSVMVRRELLSAVGGLRPQIPELMEIDAWLRILARSDAAFVDEELTARWHHLGAETYSANTGGMSALFSHLWMVAGLMQNKDLDRSVRLAATRLWGKAVARTCKDLQHLPKNERHPHSKRLRAHIREVTAGRPANTS